MEAGAAAVLLEPDHEGNGVVDAILKTDGSGKDLLRVKRGGSAYRLSNDTLDNGEHYFFQDGKSVFKHAVTKMADVAVEILAKNNLTGDDIAYLVPHQANLRIAQFIQRKFKLPDENVYNNIMKYGNTTAASVIIALTEAWELGKIKDNDLVVLAAFGSGFTWGSVVIRW